MGKKVNYIIILLALFIPRVQSQDDNVIRPGLIRFMATLSPSKSFAYNEAYFYLHGNLEGYITKNVSAVGDGYMFLGETTKAPQAFKFQHNLFYGFNYRFTKKQSDLYLGFQPGISIAQVATDSVKVPVAKTGVDPVASITLGVNQYVGKFFHFFIQTRYIAGNHLYSWPKAISEIRLSAGLGFNFNAIRAK